MDTDCKGDRVCEDGSCVSPPPSGAAGESAPAAGNTPPAAANSAPSNVVGTRPLVPPPPYAQPESPSGASSKPAMQRHSTGMMAGGIVMVSFVPVTLLVVMVASLQKTVCDNDTYYSSGGTTLPRTDCDDYNPTIYGGLLTGAALLGVGIPLIVIGGKKEPVGTARVAPWATPHGAGLGLRVDL